jgi:glycosyltransferase involved in cell wall biosynthesis
MEMAGVRMATNDTASPPASPVRALSVVMPVYNEEAAIAQAVADVRTHVLDAVADSELVVVDDGSSDKTGVLLDEMARGDARMRVIHQANHGHGGALMTALQSARGAWLLLLDSDGQIPLDRFPETWSARTEHDAVFGVRRRRHDPPHRLWLSAMIRFAVARMFAVSLQDANAPFKLVRRSVWDSARACIPQGTLAPSLFLAIFARSRGFRTLEVDVVHRPRTTGTSSIRRWRLLKFCVTAFRQLLAFRACLRRGR